MMRKYSIINTFLLIATLGLLSLLLIVLSNKYILTQDFYDRNGQPLAGIPELESIAYRNIEKIIYVYAALYLLVKLCLITLVLFTGLYYFEIKVSFRDILRIVTLAEFIFLIPAIVKIWWFYYHIPDTSLERWENYYFLSAASLCDYIKPVNLYPLQTFNAFEITYWFLLAAGIKRLVKIDFDSSLRVVLSAYLPALFLWVILVVFFTMMYFPQAY
jgi:hypothetical protein